MTTQTTSATLTVAAWRTLILKALAEEFTSSAVESVLEDNFTSEDHKAWWDAEVTANVENACDALEELGLPREIQVWEQGNVNFDSREVDMSTVQVPVEEFFSILDETEDVELVQSAAIEHADVYLFTNQLDYFVLVKGDGHNDDEFHHFDNKESASAKFNSLANEEGSMA